ncbi:TniQ family protein [Ferdinandcohnia sp. SAFN-114]|uniref:TniQ family protein n=1 Tax=Ferdinandcohnia sp. SAFN-114 TaxID=3387275 RepID=UPI003F7D06E8
MNELENNGFLPRSKLFSIEPIGLGTPYVESLTSYISRLADYHCVFTGVLLSKLLALYLDKYYITAIGSRGGNGFYDSSSGVNGIGTLASDFVEVIENLTSRSNLKMLTLLSWASITSTRNLLDIKKKWCPYCFDELFATGQQIYEPLIWCFKESKNCLKHNIPLHTSCEKCEIKMNPLSRNSKPGYCDNCRSWLGNEGEISHSITHQLSKSIEINIGKILEVTTLTESEFHFNQDMVSISLKYYLHSVFNGNIKAFSRFAEIPYSTFRYWLKGENIPQFSILNSICNKLEIDIMDFFEMKLIDSLNINNIKQEDMTCSLNERKRFDHEKIKKILLNEINNPECNSLSQIAKMIGCDRRLLSRMHPIESKKIVENYQNNIVSKKIERQERTKQKLVETFEKLKERNIYPSRRVVEKELGGNLLLKESFIRETWGELKQTYD